jgi:predicted transcriptional regulator of viral defense system
MKPLTNRQITVFCAIVLYHRHHGYWPSIRDVAKAMGSSTNAAFLAIGRLRKKGWLCLADRDIARAIVPTHAALRAMPDPGYSRSSIQDVC